MFNIGKPKWFFEYSPYSPPISSQIFLSTICQRLTPGHFTTVRVNPSASDICSFPQISLKYRYLNGLLNIPLIHLQFPPKYSFPPSVKSSHLDILRLLRSIRLPHTFVLSLTGPHSTLPLCPYASPYGKK